jgi:hypothetical protein
MPAAMTPYMLKIENETFSEDSVQWQGADLYNSGKRLSGLYIMSPRDVIPR